MPLMPHMSDAEPIGRQVLSDPPTRPVRPARLRIANYKSLYVINSAGNPRWPRQSVSRSLVSSAKPGLPG